MRLALSALAIVTICLGSASRATVASACEIEDWRWRYDATGRWLTIEGSTTCASGFAHIRLYERSGDGSRFLGVAQGLVEGHALTADAVDIDRPQSLSIKYSIDPGY